MRIATFNVNSVRAHIGNILEWLGSAGVDAVLMQEIKCVDEAFPREPFEDMGFSVETFGQKSYNGVAILSRYSIEDVNRGIPGYNDPQARYMDALIDGYFRVACVYAPNGNPIGTEKFDYKLAWMERFKDRAEDLLNLGEPLVIAGDFNVVLDDGMIYDPAAFKDDAIMQPESRAAFLAVEELGLAIAPNREYTYYGYRGGSFAKSHGIVLDYFLTGPKVGVVGVYADRTPREIPGASDHVPLVLELE
jgi:exodeoxyribonuclease-3